MKGKLLFVLLFALMPSCGTFRANIDTINEGIRAELTAAEKEEGISPYENAVRGFDYVWCHYHMRERIYDIIGIEELDDVEEIMAVENGLDDSRVYIVVDGRSENIGFVVNITGFSKDSISYRKMTLADEHWLPVKSKIEKAMNNKSAIDIELPHCHSESYIFYRVNAERATVRVVYGLFLIDDRADDYPHLVDYRLAVNALEKLL